MTYDELLTKWTQGKKTWKEIVAYNYDGSLWAFIQLLYLKKKYRAERQETQKQEKSLVDNLNEKIRDLELELRGEKQMSQAQISSLMTKIENVNYPYLTLTSLK